MPRKDSLRDPAAQAASAWRLTRQARTASGTARWKRLASKLRTRSWAIFLALALTIFALFQYLLPPTLAPGDGSIPDLRHIGWPLTVLFLLSAVVSWRAAKSPSAVPAALLEMPWLQFESLLGEVFRLDGHTLIETRSRAEHFDLTLGRGGQISIVQARRWRRKPVDESAVQELLSEMIARQVDTGTLVSTSSFTAAARELARDRGIRLIAGPELARLALFAQAQPDSKGMDAAGNQARATDQPTDSGRESSVRSRQV